MTTFELLVLLLARTCVAEIGFSASVDECVLMIEINDRNAQSKKITLAKQTLNYNQYWMTRYQRKARPWIAYLEGKNKPREWPKHLRWSNHVDKWIEYKESISQYLRNVEAKEIKYICPSAIDYGAPYDKPPNGRKLIRCLNGRTEQKYYARR